MDLPLDIPLRSGGVATGLALLLALGGRGGWRRNREVLAVLACTCAYLVCSAPSRPCCTSPATLPILLMAIAFPFAFWRLARVVLADDRRVPLTAWLAGAVLLAGGLAAAADFADFDPITRTWAAVANKLAAFGFLGAALRDGWRTWHGDLVEPRRRLRWILLGYIGAYGVAILLGEVYLVGARPPAWLDLVNVTLIDLTLAAILLFLVQPSQAALDALLAPAQAKPALPAPAAQRADAAQAADNALLERLRDLMEVQKAYRDPELSLGTLAARAGVPEYVLRRVVHHYLGHRNFASYVNDYRLVEVRERLRDPQLLRRPVLTLALESGFGSIGPFNRAFKARYGVTPTEIRQGSNSPPNGED